MHIYDTIDWNLQFILQNKSGSILVLDVSNCNKVVALGSEDCSISMWNIQTKNLINKVSGHSLAVLCLAFSNNGKHLASGGLDNSLIIWKVDDMTKFHSINLVLDLVSIVYSPDDQFLIVS